MTQVGTILRQLCRQKGVDLLEGHAMPDHIHLVLSIPPKYSVAMVVGVSERQVSDTDSPAVAESESRFHGQALLVARLLHQHGRIR